MIKLKRAYDPVERDDGVRILVERLWPRGVTKERAQVAEWTKELAPSPELRKWYSHDSAKWEEFKKRYTSELRNHQELIDGLRKIAKKQTVTLVFAAKDEQHSSAKVLKEFLERKAASR